VVKKTTTTEIDYSAMIHPEIPKLTRTTENGKFYNGILEAVKNSSQTSVRVDLPEKLLPKSAYYGFKARIKGSTYETLGFKVSLADNKVFIIVEKAE